MCENWRVYYPAIMEVFSMRKGISLLTLKQERNKIDIHIKNYIFSIFAGKECQERQQMLSDQSSHCPTLLTFPHLSCNQPSPVSMNLVRKKERSRANSLPFCPVSHLLAAETGWHVQGHVKLKRPSVSPCNMQEDRWPE